MLKSFKTTCLLLAAGVCSILSCNNAPTSAETEQKTGAVDSSAVTVEIYDQAFANAIDTNAKTEVISTGYDWSEGPVWVPKLQLLLFSDVPKNTAYQWKEGSGTSVFLKPSGYTNPVPRVGGEDGSNGLTLDINGKLLLCQSGDRKIARLNTPLDSPKAQYTILADNYKGKKFNSPNDLVTDKKNNIYFTDPIYGLPGQENDSTRELKFEGVYRLSTNGKLELLIDSIARPNGIALSLDEKILYIASSDNIKPAWYEYKLDSTGHITSGKVLLDAIPLKEKAAVKGAPDGFKIDKFGNIFSSGPDGINIISPEGKLVGLIKIPKRHVANCAFNETKDILYVTADDQILKITMHP